MYPSFWHERWQTGQTGFHQDVVHPMLAQAWPLLGLETGARVFVPLCGKSVDMRWLAARGHEIIGVELSPIAVRDFFACDGLQASSDRSGPLESLRAGPYTLLAGDFFDLDVATLGPVQACYDRAALVALPVSMRRAYVAHCARLLPPETTALLITLEYDQQQMEGPPFSVDDAEVRALYGGAFTIEQLCREDVLTANPKFRDRGLDWLLETAYRLTRLEP